MADEKQTAAVQVDVTPIIREKIAAEVAASLADPGMILRFVDAVLSKEDASASRYSRGKVSWLQTQTNLIVEMVAKRIIAEQVEKFPELFREAIAKRMGGRLEDLANSVADSFIDTIGSGVDTVFKVKWTPKERY